jgi:hypothetical protein
VTSGRIASHSTDSDLLMTKATVSLALNSDINYINARIIVPSGRVV